MAIESYSFRHPKEGEGAVVSGYVHIDGTCYRFDYDTEPVDWESQLLADWEMGALKYIGDVG